MVLLEDSAAELGLSMAFVGVGLAALTGDPLYDAARVIDDAQDRLHTAAPNARIVYLEPELPVPADSTADAPTRTSEP